MALFPRKNTIRSPFVDLRSASASVLICVLACGAPGAARFPDWLDKILPFGGEWELASAVVVGDITGARYIGRRQRIPRDRLNPAGLPVTGKWLYWCEADLKWDVLIKGTPPPPAKKYLWSDSFPGCDGHRFDYGATNVTLRVWLVREDGPYLRPVTDTRGRAYYAFQTTAKIEPGGGAVAQLGRLMTPEAAVPSPAAYENIFWGAASLARGLLPAVEFRSRVLRLTSSGDADLRARACMFLEQFLREPCAR